MYQYIVIVILAVLLGFTFKSNIEKSKEIATLEDSIDAYNKAQEKSVKTITQIREVVNMLKIPVIVITSLFLMILLSSCKSNARSLEETCYRTITTYGDAIECVVRYKNSR